MAQKAARLLRLPAVIERTGLGRNSIYELERAGRFPRRRKLTPRASAWLESEINAWIEARPVVGESGAEGSPHA